MNARTPRFFLLDSLRGVAALMVLSTHSAFVSGALSPRSSIRSYEARLEAAFAIFFVISGFLLYRPFVKARLNGEQPLSSRAYAWRRFLRIVPAFWVAITVIAVLFAGYGLTNGHDVVYNYGFLQLYRGNTPTNVIPQAWTLCVEVSFYALLPVWAGMMRRLPGRTFRERFRWELALVGLVIVGSVGYNAALVYSGAVDRIPFAPTPALAALPGYMDHIGLGMLLAVVSVWVDHRDGRLPRPFALLARFPSICFAVAVVAIWFGATQIGLTGNPRQLYSPTQYVLRHLLNSTIGAALVFVAVFGDPRKGLTRRILGTPALIYLGLISYGFYLYHFAVITQLYHWKFYEVHFMHPYIRWYLAALIGGVLFGSASYYLVERPALSLKGLVRPRPLARDEALAEPAPATPVTTPPA